MHTRALAGPALGSLLVIVSMAVPAHAGNPADTLDSLELAIDLYDMAYYQEAHVIYERIDPNLLDARSRQLWQRVGGKIRAAAGELHEADAALGEARTAIGRGDLGVARRQLADVLLSTAVPLTTKQSAHDLFANIGRAPARHPINVHDPREVPAPINHRRIARTLVGEGLATLGHGQLQQASSFFGMAAWHAPRAPRRAIIVDPSSGVGLETQPGSDLSRLAVGEIHNVHVASVVRPVTMNVQLGLGRLVSLDTFRFSDPGGAGSAGGWVQIPSINRTQIKTTVTAPAQEVSLETGRPITYLILVRPEP